MRWMLFLPGLLGLASVMQSALNRQLAKSWGVPAAVLINTLVFLVLSVGFYVSARSAARGPFQWWFLVPGVLGFCLVAGMPLAIARIGAFSAYAMLIAGQLITSLIWDAVVEGAPLTAVRGIGAALLVASAVMISIKK